jgi:hypothetical protein
MKPPLVAAFSLLFAMTTRVVVILITKVFNMFVEIPVENRPGIFVTDSARDALALCTGAGAGTFWVVPLALLFHHGDTS